MNPRHVALSVAALLAGLAGGYLLRGAGSAVPPSGATTARQVLYWYDPMHPEQHFEQPGRSPFMDMDLVPRYADGGDAAEGDSVRIEPRMLQNLGVRVASAERGRLESELLLNGTIAFDASAAEVVQARARGFLSRVYQRRPLAPVRRGEPLAEFVAPEWSAALAEYRALQQLQGADATALRDAARQRLATLGVPASALRESTTASVTLLAPRDGLLSVIEAREGQAVEPGATLFRINAIDRVWLEVAVPEALATQLQPGQTLSASVVAWPGRHFAGRVAAVLPEVDPQTRSLRLRVELDNPDAALVPGMFARVRLDAVPTAEQLLVPSEAVIRTGRRSVVVVEEGSGRFVPHEVTLGAEAGGHTVILDGLDEGARVVVSGQFLIDSEASLRGVLRRLGPADDHDAMDHGSMDHGSMDHGSMDHGSMDHGSMDQGSMDHGSMDQGSMDHGSMDHGMPAIQVHAPAAVAPAAGPEGHRAEPPR